MKKIISVLILLSYTMLLLPLNAFAAESGTKNNPYLISSAEELNAIHNDLSAYYKLTDDIDMSGVDFVPIGNEDEGAFTGTIDGDGFKISNLNIDLPDEKYVGFVGYLEGTVKNLTLENATATGWRYVGAVVGYSSATADVSDCSASGKVTGVFQIIDLNTGGICGYNAGEITNCNNETAVVSANNSTAYAGGIAGYNTGNISYCENNNTVEGFYVGGIVGYNNGEIKNCENESELFSEIVNGYVGGISGYNNNIICDCINNGAVISNVANDVYYKESKIFIGGVSGYNNAIIRTSKNFEEISANLSDSESGRIYTYVGGITSFNNYLVNNCNNCGAIYGNSYLSDANSTGAYTYSGGISAINKNKISNSMNMAMITSESRAYDVTANATVGGISAYNEGTIEYTINYGDTLSYTEYTGDGHTPGGAGEVIGEYHINGGITGENKGSLFYSINSGNAQVLWQSFLKSSLYGGITGKNSGTVTDCINMGRIKDKTNKTICGGLCGHTTNTIKSSINIADNGIYGTKDTTKSTNSYQLTNVLNDSKLPNNYLLNLNQMKNQENLPDLDFENVWYIDPDLNSGLPQLRNMPEHIDLNEIVKIMEVGDTFDLIAYMNGNEENVIWSSDDSGIASVTSNGRVTARTPGSCMITAVNSDGMKANCLVHVYYKADSMELSNNEITVNKDATHTLVAIQSPGNASENVFWKSEDDAIATVNQNGVVTGKNKGTTKVYATTTQGEVRAECIVNVSTPITTITLPFTSKSINLGDTYTLTATLSPADFMGDITWSSSDETVATIDEDGKITTHKLGSTEIVATATSGVTAKCTINVTKPSTSITLNKSTITTYVNSTYQLSASLLPLDTTDTITWTSSSTSYATVSATGLVTGKKAGTATITVKTTSGLTATCYVTVNAKKVEPTAITLSSTYITLAPDDAKALTVTYAPTSTTEKTLTWTSSDESVAIVDKNGIVTAKGEGFTTIKAITTNGLSQECVVKVVSAAGPSIVMENVKAMPKETAKVKVNIVKNPGISGYKFTVNYDADILTPVSVNQNSEFGGTITTNLDDENRTEFNVVWYSADENKDINGELFTINFVVNAGVEPGTVSEVSLSYGAKDICNTDGEYMAFYTENAKVRIEEPLPGDIYEDDDINIYDLTLLARYITGVESFTDRQKVASDVNNDELVDIKDVVKLAQYIVGWSGVELMSLMSIEDEMNEKPVVIIGSASANESGEAEIPVYIKNNVGFAGYRMVIDYNSEDIEILSITPSKLINKNNFTTNLGQENEEGLIVSCYQEGNATIDGELFTVKVRYKNSASDMVSPINIIDADNNFCNQAIENVVCDYETGYVLGDDYIVSNEVVGETNFACELYFDNSYAEQSAKAIIAFYDSDGKMVQLMPKDITVKPGKVDLSIDYDKKAYATYKLMIWEDLNNLKPITKVK